MTATPLTITQAPTLYSTVGAVVTMDAGDVGNGNVIPFTGNIMMVIAHNTDASPQTITITSVGAPVTGRTGDVNAESLAAGEIRVFRLARDGWVDANGEVAISVSDANVEIGVLNF